MRPEDPPAPQPKPIIAGWGNDDSLIGGEGRDALASGLGADRFVFGAGFGRDAIVDFAAGAGAGDVIAFSLSIFAGFGAILALGLSSSFEDAPYDPNHSTFAAGSPVGRPSHGQRTSALMTNRKPSAERNRCIVLSYIEFSVLCSRHSETCSAGSTE